MSDDIDQLRHDEGTAEFLKTYLTKLNSQRQQILDEISQVNAMLDELDTRMKETRKKLRNK